MPKDLKCYRVFIASPAGLETERKAIKDVIEENNKIDALARNVFFEVIGWEMLLGGVGRPQTLINDQLKTCDYFVMLLCDRWGRPTSDQDTSKYSSGTEEEYHVALECFENPAHQMQNLAIFFKAVNFKQMADPGPQLTKVLEFKIGLQQNKSIFYEEFDDICSIKFRIRHHLAKWLRDHDNVVKKGSIPYTSKPLYDSDIIRNVQTGDDDLDPLIHNDSVAENIKKAESYANQGDLIKAENIFVRCIVENNSLIALNKYGVFLMRVNKLSKANRMFDRVFELANLSFNEKWQAMALNNIGLVKLRQGKYFEAEKAFRNSLSINENISRLQGIAASYGNLSLLYGDTKDFNRAEDYSIKSINIYKKIENFNKVAYNYDNLSVIYKNQHRLCMATEMALKALEIYEQHGYSKGIARSCVNLGLIYQITGDQNKAEEMFTRSLEIHKNLHSSDIFMSYTGLGLVYYSKRDLISAEEMLVKSVEIIENNNLHNKNAVTSFILLGSIYSAQGDHEKREYMEKKAREIQARISR